MNLVVDASVLVAALVDSSPVGAWAEQQIGQSSLCAPELILIETTKVLRRLERSGDLTTFEATVAQRDLLRLRLQLVPYATFAERVWALRDNVTAYDAAYVAIAEALRIPLATLDKTLSRSMSSRFRSSSSFSIFFFFPKRSIVSPAPVTL